MRKFRDAVFAAVMVLLGLVLAPEAPAATLLPNGEQTFVDSNGVPFAGGSVYFYIPNTLTPKTTWVNSTQATPNANPVVLDAAGRAIIYGSGVYRQILKDSGGNTVWDQLTADTSSTGQSFAGTSTGSANAQILSGGTFSQTNGQVVTFIAGTTNTGATTLLINGFGPISVDKDLISGPAPLTGNEIVTGNQVTVVYDSIAGVFHLVSFPPATSPVYAGLTDTGAFSLSGNISPAALTTSTDNWNPTGLSTASVVRMSATSAIQLTGVLARPAGTVLSLQNVGSFAIELVADSASSVAANQFDFTRSELVQPGQSLLLQYDATSVGWRLWQGSASFITPSGVKRQTVESGPSDPTSGLPNFLPSTSASRTLVSTGVSITSPLTVSAAQGFNLSGAVDLFCQSISNLTWASLTASTTNYLLITTNPDGSCTPGFTTLAPIYSSGVAIANTNGQYTFDTVHYQTWLGNGTTATQQTVVAVGEAVTSASAVTSTVAYGYQGAFDSGYIATLPGVSTQTVFNINLGVTDVVTTLSLMNKTTEGGYAVGDIYTQPVTAIQSGTTAPVPTGNTRNTGWFTTAAFLAFQGINKTTGAAFTPTAANWFYRFTARRSW